VLGNSQGAGHLFQECPSPRALPNIKHWYKIIINFFPMRCLFHSLGKSRIGRQQEGNRVQELVKGIKPLQEEPRYVPVLVWDIGWYVQK
jgi:hypothetical protein